MSSFLFNLAIDWIMKNSTKDKKRGIRWRLFDQLEDLDYADDIALLSHSKTHMQEKSDRVANFANQLGLRINSQKTKVMLLNTKGNPQIQSYGQALESVDKFTYLGSTVTKDGGSAEDIKARIGKARNALIHLKHIWASNVYSKKTKVKVYRACVLSILLYGSETWRMTEGDLQKLSSFHNKCLRRIARVFWPNKITNIELHKKCEIDSMADIIQQRRFRWVGHCLRREKDNIARVATTWTPEGKRRVGRPKTTWRRTVEAELTDLKLTWGSAAVAAKDRLKWRTLALALHATGHNRK